VPADRWRGHLVAAATAAVLATSIVVAVALYAARWVLPPFRSTVQAVRTWQQVS
jgi:hypothetical protein